jgi:hypothetical protein
MRSLVNGTASFKKRESLAGKQTLPENSIPDLVVPVCLAGYSLYRHRRSGLDLSDDELDAIIFDIDPFNHCIFVW